VRSFIIIISLLLSVALAAAAEPVPPVARAVRTSVPPRIDGHLNEAGWRAAPVVTSFTQRDPDDGKPGTNATVVRVLYDDDALYVGARIDGPEPVTFRLGRRDMGLTSSDWFQVSLDTFRNRRNAVRFGVNPGGVKRDATINGDYFQSGGVAGNDGELAWDAVWDAATSVDDRGWTAELRIPFSQLRFAQVEQSKPTDVDEGERLLGPDLPATAEEQIWGIQFETLSARRQELAMFAYTSRSEPGGVSSFGDLHGLRDLRSSKPLELIPYVLGQATFDASDSNPLTPKRDHELKAGLDARYRITSNLTLTATLNPDFGQVEVDPAIINLTAFETRLDEKRPFFVEGSSTFRLAPSITSRNGARELVYSRRIGRNPQIDLPSDITRVPGTTNIVAAGKLTGRTERGWTIGLIDAFTDDAHGVYLDETGMRRSALVEPKTNYFVGRVSREMRGGDAAVGVIGTAVNRDLGDPLAAASLGRSAYTGGLDLGTDFLDRVWNLSAYLTGSHIEGTPEAITKLQRRSSRYYQRPDAQSFALDPGATSLSGMSGQVQLNKPTGVHWSGNAAYAVISPGYEINDIGFQQRVDRRGFSGRLTYSERTPGRFLRSSNFSLYPNLFQNYDGDWLDKGLRLQTNLQHLSYWGVETKVEYVAERIDDRLTRGGPAALQPAGWNLEATLNSDTRRPISGAFTVFTRPETSGSRSDGIVAQLDYQASRRWSMSLVPRLDWNRREAQYVDTISDPTATATYRRRYVFAPLRQTEASVEARLNYAFSSDLSLELYTQALVSDAAYGLPQEFLQPRAFRFATYGRDAGTVSRSGATYRVDPDGPGPAAAFEFDDPSFTSRSLRVNAVLRWEFRPGSVLYAVWLQERLNPLQMEDFSFGRATGTVFDAPARNGFAVKVSYWFNP
jgi:hypothetical protein